MSVTRRYGLLIVLLLAMAALSGCVTAAPGPTPTPERCQANFTADPTDTQAKYAVQFTDLSRGNMTDWAWDFDSDGVTDSSEQNPSHRYPNKTTTYSVTLTISGPCGNDTMVRNDYLHITSC